MFAKSLFVILLISASVLLLFGWVMNIVKLFNEDESSAIKTIRFIFIFFIPLFGGVMGWLTFENENPNVKIYHTKNSNRTKKIKTKKNFKNKK
ncbi:MAG: hypothetical protein LBU68_00265 [Rickettsiales bacterium]|jgi:hypothetical protein|nr:hypothetical protein [Rickettsiales bacterium]